MTTTDRQGEGVNPCGGSNTTGFASPAGADTVTRFVALPAREVRRLLTVAGARVRAELQGASCR